MPTPRKTAASKPAPAEPLEDMPAPPAKKTKTEKLQVAYTPDHSSANAGAVLDFAIFGVKLDALEHAMEQDPPWKVIEVLKGQSVRDAILAKR